MSSELTVRQVAELTGLTPHTLRYYERAGLLAPINRNGGGHRRYSDRDVDLLAFLIKLRSTGMPIQGVRRYAELVREGESTMPARREILEQHRQAMCAQRDQIERNLAVIEFKLDLYDRGQLTDSPNNPAIAELRNLCIPTQKRT